MAQQSTDLEYGRSATGSSPQQAALETNSSRAFDPLIFWVSASLTLLFVLWSIILPDQMSAVINAVFNWTTEYWGWLYLLSTFLLVLACIALLGGKFGPMKLGKLTDKPEFSTWRWP